LAIIKFRSPIFDFKGIDVKGNSVVCGALYVAALLSLFPLVAQAQQNLPSRPLQQVPMGQAAAERLLTQGTFGPTIDTLNAAAQMDYNHWFAQQAALPPSLTLPPYVAAGGLASDPDWTPYWWKNVTQGPDQLRQRVAFALSEILVVSQNNGLGFDSEAMSYYYDILSRDSLGNFRTLLGDVTLSPEMGFYLSMMRNAAGNPATGSHADENYAREILQLFTVGLNRLNLDGSLQLDSSGNPIQTYYQTDIEQLAKEFTGWSSYPTYGSPPYPYPDSNTADNSDWVYSFDLYNPMTAYPDFHDTTQKNIAFLNLTIPANASPTIASMTQELNTTLDAIFNHPNVAPFISQQLIQKLVTSNPSPAYVQRVATIFNNDGTGVRGNLLAVAKAILTDPEATQTGNSATYGKLREPLIHQVNVWRAFNGYPATPANGAFTDFQLTVYENTAGQAVLFSPTVFNFFVPGYQLAGPLESAGMVTPEFQIMNESSLVETNNNYFYGRDMDYFDSAGGEHDTNCCGYDKTIAMLHTAEWEPLAKNPTVLVNRLNTIFMEGMMSSAMKTSLTNFANGLPTGSAANLGARAVQTMDQVVESPQYMIQH
jgi:uncharacterized protein (DUF1800 family)